MEEKDLQFKPCRLSQLISRFREKDGTVVMSIEAEDRSNLETVAKNLSPHGIVEISEYGPFLDLIVPDQDTANRMINDYDSSKNRGLFTGIKEIDIAPVYEAAGIRYY